MLEEEKHERSGPGAHSRAKEIRVQPLCDCSSSSSAFVVFTCPKCMQVALRAIRELAWLELDLEGSLEEG